MFFKGLAGQETALAGDNGLCGGSCRGGCNQLLLQFIRVGTFQEALLHGPDTPGRYFGNSDHELIAQFVNLFSLFTQTSSKKENRSGWLNGACAEVQEMWRKQP